MDRQGVGPRPQPGHSLCEDLNDLQIGQPGEHSCHPGDDQPEMAASQLDSRVNANVEPFTEALLQSGSLIPPSYPCSKPLKDLNKIFLNDLVFESHNTGFYLLVRTTTPPTISALISAIIEDERGDRIPIVLSQLPPARLLGDGLERGTILIVKEPYLKWMGNGQCGIRVNHPSDANYLSRYDELVPEEWREEQIESPTIDTWEVKGNCHFDEGNFPQAIECYTKALEFPEKEETHTVNLKLSRCLAYWELGCFDAVLSEFGSLPSDVELFEGAIIGKAMALYNLEKYRECTDIIKLCLKQYPQSSYTKLALSQSISRLLESEQGKYKFKEMQDDCRKQHVPLLKCATYIGPVEIKQTEFRGRGVFTTKAVKAGDLLFCENALSYAVFTTPTTDRKNDAELEQFIYRTQQRELAKLATDRIFQVPSVLSKLSDLHHGSYTPFEASFVDGAPVFDMFLIYRIVAFNSFGSLRSSRDPHLKAPMNDRIRIAGVWSFASHINHACYGNSFRSFISNMLIVRAAADIPEDTEITFCYKPPEGDCVKGKPDHSFWGFKCDCAICKSIENTDDDVLAKRLQLIRVVGNYCTSLQRANIDRLNDELAKIERTYSEPASAAPRLSLWNMYFSIAKAYARWGWSIHVVEYVLKTLGSLGFIFTGGGLKGSSHAEMVVDKWGLVVPDMVDIWMTLSQAYRLVEPRFEAGARKYAKLSYKILVGEDETFEETYEKPSSTSFGPTFAGLVAELTEMGVPVDINDIRRRVQRGA